ncbi:MAG: hypothetical protein ACK5XN_21845 [Bacteroidota bacterium]
MGWYYSNTGGTRADLISELTESRQRKLDTGIVCKTTCLAHCFRGNVFSGVLWSVFERKFFSGEEEVLAAQRWIGCDLMHCHAGDWGHKPLEENMHPCFYSVPLGYLKMVPIEAYGGNAEWRESVKAYHAKALEKRRSKKAAAR